MAAPRRVRLQRRAGAVCEYCRLPQDASLFPHHIDHIIAQQHVGADTEENLCLCCQRCNLKKGSNIASVDPASGTRYRIVALFHPRKQRWHTHFQLHDDGCIEGRTSVGRATVRLLDCKAAERVQLRQHLMRHGWRP